MNKNDAKTGVAELRAFGGIVSMAGFLRQWRADKLESDNVDTRLRGIKKLTNSRNPEAATLLIAGLDDDDPQVRGHAAAALAVRRDPRSIRGLVKMVLRECDAVVLEQATAALEQVAGQKPLPELVSALSDDDLNVRQAAARTLRRVGWGRLDDATRAHVAILQDDWVEASGYGIAAIGPLKTTIQTGTLHNSNQAAVALGNIGGDAARLGLTGLMCDTEQEQGVREVAAMGLRRICWGNISDADLAKAAALLGEWSDLLRIGNPAVEALVEALESDDIDYRKRSAEVLSEIGTPDSAKALADTLADTRQDVSVRELAASLLGNHDDAYAASALVAALSDEYWSIRFAAAEALKQSGWHPQDRRSRILYSMVHSDWSYIESVGIEAIEPLVEVLKFHAVGLPAARALISIGQAGRDALVAVLAGRNVTLPIREIVSRALVESGDPHAVEPLRAMLCDPDFAVRQSAVWNLARLGWEPTSLSEKAMCAIVDGDWDRLRRFGAPAVEPLLCLAACEMASPETKSALEHILTVTPGRVSIDHLRRLAAMEDIRPAGTKAFRKAGDVASPNESGTDHSSIRRLSKNELSRRGLMA